MNVFKTLLFLALATLFTPLAQAECTYPNKVTLPDGSTSNTEEMVAGQSAVKQYMSDMEDYMECVDKESSAIGEDLTDEQIRVRDMRHDAAVDQMEQVANEFNAQVRAYKQAGN
jgi:hypothetical protein